MTDGAEAKLTQGTIYFAQFVAKGPCRDCKKASSCDAAARLGGAASPAAIRKLAELITSQQVPAAKFDPRRGCNNCGWSFGEGRASVGAQPSY